MAALIGTTAIAFDASAHSGRTDKNGCHHDRKNGGRHCH
ncbi:YHYH domain-containing protein [Paracandidimonas soli]